MLPWCMQQHVCRKLAQKWVQQGNGASHGAELAMGILGGDASDGALVKKPEGHGSLVIK